jgi:8-oxo-dGTP diphosphatase
VADGKLEVLLVHRPRYDDWSWPKGKLKPGEHALEAAVRETGEETGRQVVLGAPLPAVEYRLASGRVKRVRYWSARLAEDSDNPAICARSPIRIAARREIDKARWFPAARARRRLTRESDAGPLDVLVARHQAGILRTRAVVVLRHAQALKRSDWADGEATRPLTRLGERRTGRLTPLLAAYGVARVVTSPWRRCRRTVAPYARRGRLPIGTSRWLTEAGARARPARAGRLMGRILAPGPATVICSHRPVLPLLLAEVAAAAGPGGGAADGVAAAVPAKDPYLRTSEFLVAHTVPPAEGAPAKVVALELHRAE